MTTLSLEKIGLVAHYSQKGNWAFNLAFHLAKSHQLHLNVFHFPVSPYDVSLELTPSQITSPDLDTKASIDMDRQLREYYDDYLEDYTEVGFKLCANTRHNLELRQCLKEKEYQLLVIPYIDCGVNFGNMPLEEFAYRFNAPIILVGPEQADQYHLNPPAKLLMDALDLPLRKLKIIQQPVNTQPTVIPKPKTLQKLNVI